MTSPRPRVIRTTGSAPPRQISVEHFVDGAILTIEEVCANNKARALGYIVINRDEIVALVDALEGR